MLLIEVKERGKQLSGQRAFQAEGAVNAQPLGNTRSVSRDQPGEKSGQRQAIRGRAEGDKIRFKRESHGPGPYAQLQAAYFPLLCLQAGS